MVLGRRIMNEIYRDTARTTLPSWMKVAPRYMGSSSHGKLSADQWRVACTVNYPISLVRLWGAGQPISEDHPRYLEMLDNFIHLVLATAISSRRCTTKVLQDRVLFHTEQYLSGLRRLYPAQKIFPNNHLSLHIPRFLRLFGPPHAWWAFPYERFIGILQRLLTNSRFGKQTPDGRCIPHS